VKEWVEDGFDVSVVKPEPIVKFFLKKKKWWKVDDVYQGIKLETAFYIKIRNRIIFVHNRFKGYEKEKPIAVLSHMPVAHVLANRLSVMLNIPWIKAVHNSDLISDYIGNSGVDSHGLVWRSESIKKRYIEKYGNKEGEVVWSGVPGGFLLTNDEIKRKRKRMIKSNKIIFVSVCNLIPLKNINVNLVALSKLPKSSSWEYHIVGDGKEKLKLISQVKDLNIDDRVIFHGHLPPEDVREVLIKSNVFILISSPETFGLSYLEAMATGNLIIGVKNWGVYGMVCDGRESYFVDAPSVNELYNILNLVVKISIDELCKASVYAHEFACKHSEYSAAKNYIKYIECISNSYYGR